LPELAIPAPHGAPQSAIAPTGLAGVGYPTGWWLACGGDSPFDAGQTTIVTAPQLPRPLCDTTMLASCVRSSLVHALTMPVPVAQATQILPLGIVEPAVMLLASHEFLYPPRTLAPDAAHDWPRALMTGRAAPIAERQTTTHAAHRILRDLVRSTGGSAELVAETLGASRRSIYNWLKGKPVRSEFATRAQRLQLVLAPLRDAWHPEALSDWLQAGDPSPAELAAHEQWVELGERVRDALQPLRPLEATDEAIATGPAEAWPASALRAVLQEFNSAPPAPARKTAWRPRELTGSTPEPDEE
jgi:hypothetical protein